MNVWTISLAVCLMVPFDPHASTTCHHCPFHFTSLSKKMNHPYMFPENAPWTDEYKELKEIRRVRYIQNGIERYEIDDTEPDGIHCVLF